MFDKSNWLFSCYSTLKKQANNHCNNHCKSFLLFGQLRYTVTHEQDQPSLVKAGTPSRCFQLLIFYFIYFKG